MAKFKDVTIICFYVKIFVKNIRQYLKFFGESGEVFSNIGMIKKIVSKHSSKKRVNGENYLFYK